MNKTLVWVLHVHDVDKLQEKQIFHYVFRRVTQYSVKTGHNGKTNSSPYL